MHNRTKNKKKTDAEWNNKLEIIKKNYIIKSLKKTKNYDKIKIRCLIKTK